jgi:hypothetical protein
MEHSYHALLNKAIHHLLVSVKPSYKKTTIPDYFNDKLSWMDIFEVFKPCRAGAESSDDKTKTFLKVFFVEIEYQGIKYKQTSLINEKTAALELLIKLSLST